MKAITDQIQTEPLVSIEGKRGDILYAFAPAFIKKLEREVADHIAKTTGHSVRPYGDDQPRMGPQNHDYFNPKVPDKLREDFSRRLRLSVEDFINICKKEKPGDQLSYEVGLDLCVGCGEWHDAALFDLERTVVRASVS